jgi:hypothetical protein
MEGFAPDCAGRMCRCPGLLADEERTRVAALTLLCGKPDHCARMANIDRQVKAVAAGDQLA